jgi:hypothetical protein
MKADHPLRGIRLTRMALLTKSLARDDGTGSFALAVTSPADPAVISSG